MLRIKDNTAHRGRLAATLLLLLLIVSTSVLAVKDNGTTVTRAADGCTVNLVFQVAVEGTDAEVASVKTALEACLNMTCEIPCDPPDAILHCDVNSSVDVKKWGDLSNADKAKYHHMTMSNNISHVNGLGTPNNGTTSGEFERSGSQGLTGTDLHRGWCHEVMHLGGLEDQYCDIRRRRGGNAEVRSCGAGGPNPCDCAITAGQNRCTKPCNGFENNIMATLGSDVSCANILAIVALAGLNSCPTIPCCDLSWLFHGFHWGYDYPWHNPFSTWPPYAYPQICVFDQDILVTTIMIEIPWWWWCSVWPPLSFDYWLGIAIPDELLLTGGVQIIPPVITQGGEGCQGPNMGSYIPTEIVQLDLTSNFPITGSTWMGFGMSDAVLPESTFTTRFQINIFNDALRNYSGQPSITIMAGDSLFGWSPTVYENITLPIGPPGCCVIRGDANHSDGAVPIDVLDILYIVSYLFQGGSAPVCIEEADANGLGGAVPVDVTDLLYLVGYLFQGGPMPPPCF